MYIFTDVFGLDKKKVLGWSNIATSWKLFPYMLLQLAWFFKIYIIIPANITKNGMGWTHKFISHFSLQYM